MFLQTKVAVFFCTLNVTQPIENEAPWRPTRLQQFAFSSMFHLFSDREMVQELETIVMIIQLFGTSFLHNQVDKGNLVIYSF